MEEENPNTCRALITRDPNMPPNSPLSYFISITIPQPKLRIKIPKLLVKTMQRRSQKCSNEADEFDQNKNKNKCVKPRRLFLRKKVGSIIHNVFGSKKSQEIMEELEEDNEKKLNCGDGPFQISTPETKISKSYSLKEILEIENEREKQEMLEGLKSSQQSDMADKQPLKGPGSLSLSGLFITKDHLSFIKGKMNKACNCSYRDKRGDNGVGSSFRVIGKQESSSNLTRVPSGRAIGCRNIRRVKSTRKKVTKQVEEDSEQEGEELCKKRILMGGRCRTINLSGALHYDENGILLPEAIPCEELEITRLDSTQLNSTKLAT
ncbi:hypothetical protein F0562_020000 [Nyssa sinensis]|uniref:Uncharacterized protein n=1 Tax=Nyssa sinensis TaxID=561372 RepID=A0A5J5BRI2_9ASTE|nr:hypothetical protein F0562_020000 [Nyssa sinensis]